MIKLNLSACLIGLAIFYGMPSFSQSPGPLQAQIDSIANAYLADTLNVGLIIGVFPGSNRQPQIFSYGLVKKGSAEVPDSNTLYKLGSIGKTFTATVLAYYTDRYPKKVRLDDPINKFFPAGQKLPYWMATESDPKNAGRSKDTIRITLLDLATHYSSLPDSPPNRVAPPGYTIPKLLDFLGSDLPGYHVRPLPEKPGTKWIYSNTGFGLLGVVMERVSGKNYQDLLDTVFINELNMPNTRIRLNAEQRSHLATGYEKGKAVPSATPTSPGFYGAGGNYSCMKDMLNYLAWNMGFDKGSGLNNLLNTLHEERDTTGNKNAWIALAWQINYLRKDDQQQKYTWKDGGTIGYTTYIAFVPKTRTGVVVLTNSSGKGLNRPTSDQVGIAVLRAMNPAKL